MDRGEDPRSIVGLCPAIARDIPIDLGYPEPDKLKEATNDDYSET
jgi:hypothetical protein